MATKRPKNIPTIPPEQLGKLAVVLGRTKMNRRAKTSLMQILIEAATPDRHGPERLDGERAQNVKRSSEILTERAMSQVKRAGRALLDMPDEEWNRLVEEANRDHTGGHEPE
jgi:hypothetical protein